MRPQFPVPWFKPCFLPVGGKASGRAAAGAAELKRGKRSRRVCSAGGTVLSLNADSVRAHQTPGDVAFSPGEETGHKSLSSRGRNPVPPWDLLLGEPSPGLQETSPGGWMVEILGPQKASDMELRAARAGLPLGWNEMTWQTPPEGTGPEVTRSG